jgi:hypothetical protein
MILLLAVALEFVGSASPRPKPFRTPVLFIGSLHSETPVKQSTCAPPSWSNSSKPAHSAPGSSDSTCISIACGFSEADLTVDQVLGGVFDGERGLLRYTVGEWCQSEFAGVTKRALVCVYKTDGEASFRVEPVYDTRDGEVILLQRMEQIGDVELASLLKPLPKQIRYGDVSWFASEYLDGLVARGLVTVKGQRVLALKGVFIKDLARRLSRDPWKPRHLGTLVSDGLGGFVEIPRDNGDRQNVPGAIEQWDC